MSQPLIQLQHWLYSNELKFLTEIQLTKTNGWWKCPLEQNYLGSIGDLRERFPQAHTGQMFPSRIRLPLTELTERAWNQILQFDWQSYENKSTAAMQVIIGININRGFVVVLSISNDVSLL